MSFFVRTSPAPAPRTRASRQMSIMYAGVLIVFLVAQLFTFDEFIALFAQFNLPLSEPIVYALPSIIIVLELFALPFLLTMSVSVAFRWLSLLSSWLVPVFWLLISGWVVSTYQAVETIGFLGTAVLLVPGWWAVCISFALLILAAWSSWGLWPLRKTKK